VENSLLGFLVSWQKVLEGLPVVNLDFNFLLTDV